MWATKLQFQILEEFTASFSPSSLAGGRAGRGGDPGEMAKREGYIYIFVSLRMESQAKMKLGYPFIHYPGIRLFIPFVTWDTEQ